MDVILLEDVKTLGKKGQMLRLMMAMQEIMCFLKSLELRQQLRILMTLS